MRVFKSILFLLILMFGFQIIAFAGDRNLDYLVCKITRGQECPRLYISDGALEYQAWNDCYSYNNIVAVGDIDLSSVNLSGRVVSFQSSSSNRIKCTTKDECYGPSVVKEETKSSLSINALDQEKAAELFKILKSL